MNWRAALLGAVIVIAAGAAVGVVIGGKTTTEVKTVTITDANAAPTPSPTSTAAGGPAATETTPSGIPTSPSTSTLEPQYLDADTEPTTNNNISIDTSSDHPKDQIGGETVTDAVIVDPFGESATAPATVTYSPTSPDYKYLRARMGFEHGTAAGADVTVDFREDSERGRKLVPTQRFRSPSPRSITVPLTGARNVAIVFNNNSCNADNGNSCTVYDPTFVMGMARFTG